MLAAFVVALQSVFSGKKRPPRIHACADMTCPRCKSPSVAPAKPGLDACLDCDHRWSV